MSDRNTEPIVNDIDPFMDTGKAAREVLRLVKDVLQKEDEILHQQRAFCERWDREHKKSRSIAIAIWAWFKAWLSHGSETAKKIRIDE